jgi:hypothetical protein
VEVEGGGWRVEGGGWRVEGGGWRVEGGELTAVVTIRYIDYIDLND